MDKYAYIEVDENGVRESEYGNLLRESGALLSDFLCAILFDRLLLQNERMCEVKENFSLEKSEYVSLCG